MCEPHSGLMLDDSVWLLSVFSLVLCVAGLRCESSARRLLCLRVVTASSCFSVDEYIAIAKEKHGYNMEQVRVVRFCGGGGFRANLLPCVLCGGQRCFRISSALGGS